MTLANYAGWSPGQLEGEIATGSWVTLPARASLVFWDGAEDLWEAVMKEYNGRQLTDLLGIREVPDGPEHELTPSIPGALLTGPDPSLPRRGARPRSVPDAAEKLPGLEVLDRRPGARVREGAEALHFEHVFVRERLVVHAAGRGSACPSRYPNRLTNRVPPLR